MTTLAETYESMKLTNAEYDLKERTEDELIDYMLRATNKLVYFQLIGSDEAHGYTYMRGECHVLCIATPNYFVLSHELAHINDDRGLHGKNNHDDHFMETWKRILEEK